MWELLPSVFMGARFLGPPLFKELTPSGAPRHNWPGSSASSRGSLPCSLGRGFWVFLLPGLPLATAASPPPPLTGARSLPNSEWGGGGGWNFPEVWIHQRDRRKGEGKRCTAAWAPLSPCPAQLPPRRAPCSSFLARAGGEG